MNFVPILAGEHDTFQDVPEIGTYIESTEPSDDLFWGGCKDYLPNAHIEIIPKPLERELGDQLAELALMILGEHLWGLHIQFPNSSKPTVCLCLCCDTARKAYSRVTGTWPTIEQHTKAMEKWAHGWKETE